jgi:hypothetical protein
MVFGIIMRRMIDKRHYHGSRSSSQAGNVSARDLSETPGNHRFQVFSRPVLSSQSLITLPHTLSYRIYVFHRVQSLNGTVAFAEMPGNEFTHMVLATAVFHNNLPNWPILLRSLLTQRQPAPAESSRPPRSRRRRTCSAARR